MQLSFAYDADGIRTSKTVDNVTHNYITQSGKVVRETIGTGTIAKVLDFIYDASGRPFALKYTNGTADAVTYYYVLNLQGDVVGLIDENADFVAKYTYNAWGEVLTATGTMAEINPLRYRGYYYDTETGFYYLQSRYYDPLSHRFINADSLASTGQGILGTNMFAYCNNNPIIFSDYSGRSATLVAWLTTYAAANWWNPSGWAAAAAITLAIAGLYIGDYLYDLFLEENSNYVEVPTIATEDHASTEEEPTEPEPPDVTYPGDDPTVAPGGTEWRGKGTEGGKFGNYYNPNTGESWHPDLDHPQPIGPHWDYKDINGIWWRIADGKAPTLK